MRSDQQSRRAAMRVMCALMAAMVLSAGALRVTAQAAGERGTIRIWGHGHHGQDYILTLLQAWEDGFGQTHPGTRFDNELDGDASAIGGLFTDTADLAILDREASFIEVDAYQQGTGFDPWRMAVASGSVATAHHAPALVIYVNPANPLKYLTLRQLDGIFDADHRLGAMRYRTWGDLGLTGEWALQPIRLYTYQIESAEMQFFERAAMKGSQKFACCLTTFASNPGNSATEQIAEAVAKDRFGLAMIASEEPQLKPVPLSAKEAGEAVLPTAGAIATGSYPLARTVYVYAKRKPNALVPAKVAAFLSYIVSPEGQLIAAHTGGYLPLPPDAAAQSREALR